MFGFSESQMSPSKAVVSTGRLNKFVDPQQPPSKKKPFSAIMNQPFTHTVELLLPEEMYNLVWKEISNKMNHLQYSRAIMPLSALLEGDFFNLYIKTGNILMLSEGRAGVDDKYILKDGQLRLELAKENYERSGLVGKPIHDGGRKHVKTRYSVVIDLRQPSMLHGKKGFERIVWAFKNVLNRSVTWLFHDFEESPDKSVERPIAKHHPVTTHISPQLRSIESILSPELVPAPSLNSDDEFQDWALETYEWLSLVGIKSPRVLVGDSVDPFLCRYRLSYPQGDSREKLNSLNMVSATWTGLLPAQWIRNLFVNVT